jgi:spermidine synthase
MPSKKTVLFTGESPYGKYKVVDLTYNGRPARVLFGDRNTPQSGMARDDDPELLFDYNQRFLEMIMSQRPKRLLVIGGGAFMLPIGAYRMFPELTIDVVEVDDLLVQIAKDFFSLPEDSRLSVHVEDGIEFLRRTKRRYDMIIVDVFSGFTVPPVFTEKGTFSLYRKHLSRKGVIAMNFISEYLPRRHRLAHELIAAADEIFPEVEVYQAHLEYPKGGEQNLLLTASRAPLRLVYLQTEMLTRLP